MSVENKVAIVTGAASGIGLATASLFARQGARVVLADVDAAAIQELQRELERAGGTALAFGCDVGDSAQTRGLVERTTAAFGRIDVLVHAAGVCPRVPLLEMTDAQWRDVMRVNLDGAFYVTRDVARVMAGQRSGTMVLLTSDRGVYGSADYGHYAASKGGTIALVRSLALSLGRFGVTVNGLNPGMTDTPLARGANPTSWDAKVGLDVLGKASRPEEIAQTILFLAATGGEYTTGQIVGTRLRVGQ